MPDTFTYGTCVYYPILVNDSLGLISTLTGTTPEFDVRKSDGTYLLTDRTAVVDSNDNMRALCLLDMTTSGNATSPDGTIHTYWPAGNYSVYLELTIGTERPRFGPFPIIVSDAYQGP